MAALVLGGVHAGVGKSVLALGLAAALRAEGLNVSSYAVGPGLPQHPPERSSCLGKLPQHATGLDGWLLSPDAARAAFHSLSAGADISLIEGCLGMFDGPGADGSEQGSTAQVTQWLQAPVVLVVDAQAFKSARGIVALIKGYTAVDGGLGVAGVILNKVSNKALAAELEDGLKAAGLDVAVLGGVPKLEELSSTSSNSSSGKQLACPWSPGSTTSSSCCSASQCQQQQQLPCSPQQLGQLLAQHIDLQQLQAVAARAAVPQAAAPLPPAVRTYRVSMGIAHDEAFYQYFQQNLHMLSAAGVQLVPFSPLHDSKLQPGLSAVLLGGGAVAECGQQLAGNRPMLEALRAFAAAGGLVMGEGAALMYLSRSLQRPGQLQHSMVGLLPFHTKEQQQDPSNTLSYVAVDVQASAHPLLLPGSQLRGLASCCCQVVEERLVGGLSAALAAASTAAPAADHQQLGNSADGAAVGSAEAGAAGSMSALRSMPVSHSYSCTPLAQQSTAAAVATAVEEGYTCGTVLGSCLQLHYGSCPEIVQHITQRCLRVDVASVTAAASAAASQAAREAEEVAAAFAAANAASAAAAVAAAPSVLGMMRPPSPLLVPGTPIAEAAMLQAADASLQQQGQAAHGSRALSAPDLQRVLWQQCSAADVAAGSSPSGESWMAAYPGASAAGYSQSSAACRKSASIPSSMYQLAGTPDQQYLQQHMLAQQQGQPGMPRNASFNGMTQQQQQQQQQQQGSGHGWHPLPLHVPKRWSLELQRLGSFTSQLLPGAKSPTGQQGQQGPQQQQQQHGRGHSRNSSFGMGHLPEEAPLSDAALKVLESSLPSLLGRTHQTHMGLAVPLSSACSSSAGAACTAAAAGGASSFSAPGSFGAGSSCGAAGGPGSYLQRLEVGSISKSSSVHEQMSQLAASLAQQDGAAAGASAAPSACGESTACTDWEGSACGEQQKKGGATASWLPPGSSMDGLPPAGPHPYSSLQHKQQLQLLPQGQQRLSLDQRSAFSLHQQQQQAAVAAAGARMSLDSTVYPPAGLARIQQHLLPEEQSAGSSSGITQELSLKGMLSQRLQQQHGTPRGSTDNLLAAGVGGVSKSLSSSKLSGVGGVSKSNSSSKLSVQTLAVGPGAGSIVSLSPAATDCLIALGLINRLSGITDACRLAEQASASSSSSSSGSSSSSFASPLGPLLEGLVGAAWASEAAAVAKVAAAECNLPVVCRLVDGPDGMPRYKLDEDHIRRAQPSLVVVACEENSRDEPHVQHHQQLQDSTRRKSAAGGSDAADAAQGSGADAAANWAWPISPAGQVGSTTNEAVAVPGRVRLEVAVVQRVLQRAGVLWPEQRAVVLYQRCHSVSEVLEFILVLANAAGVPERGVQLVAGLRARLRAAACRVCRSMRSSRASSLAVSRRGSSSGDGGDAVSAGAPLVMVLDGVNPVRLAGFWLPEMLQLAGGKQASICPAAAEPPSTISWSQLRAAAPGMLVLALQGLSAGQAALHMEQLAVQPGFWALPAVRCGAVYAVDHTLLCRPGPGLVLGVELLGHLVAPEKQPLPAGLPMGSVLKLSLHSGQRCRPRLLPNYMARYC